MRGLNSKSRWDDLEKEHLMVPAGFCTHMHTCAYIHLHMSTQILPPSRHLGFESGQRAYAGSRSKSRASVECKKRMCTASPGHHIESNVWGKGAWRWLLHLPSDCPQPREEPGCPFTPALNPCTGMVHITPMKHGAVEGLAWGFPNFNHPRQQFILWFSSSFQAPFALGTSCLCQD